jgi:hypothetical protein
VTPAVRGALLVLVTLLGTGCLPSATPGSSLVATNFPVTDPPSATATDQPTETDEVTELPTPTPTPTPTHQPSLPQSSPTDEAPSSTPSGSQAGSDADDCAEFLPSDRIQQALGVAIGEPTSIPSALTFACVWGDVSWSLQGQEKVPPFPPPPDQLEGLACATSGLLNDQTLYCLNEGMDAGNTFVGGNIYTSEWGFILNTIEVTLADVVDKLLPILDETGN